MQHALVDNNPADATRTLVPSPPQANNRRSCSVCHKPYLVEEVVTRCDFRERLEHALQLYRNRLVVATLLLLAIASAFFYAYYLFTIKVLPI